jgi:hypothetical protein
MFPRHDQAFDTNAFTTSARRSQWRTLKLGGLDNAAPCSTHGTSVQSAYPWLLGPLRGGEADDLLFGPDGERAFCRRQESFLDILLGVGNKIAATTQVELALNIFAVALNRFNTETERMSDLSAAEP